MMFVYVYLPRGFVEPFLFDQAKSLGTESGWLKGRIGSTLPGARACQGRGLVKVWVNPGSFLQHQLGT